MIRKGRHGPYWLVPIERKHGQALRSSEFKNSELLYLLKEFPVFRAFITLIAGLVLL